LVFLETTVFLEYFKKKLLPNVPQLWKIRKNTAKNIHSQIDVDTTLKIPLEVVKP
jgi:hypothetical protein